ncbi:transcription factor SPT20 homolog isoform X1 [Asterias rubens]|uniref:transcription factor SPT20 homolog isoform X1 n=1 Tax=Asterias rubens TaxID=7604 RepID=UPI0014552258|nr:transcription factor SPT20 homolog isoform X1 [Asterias rubens]
MTSNLEEAIQTAEAILHHAEHKPTKPRTIGNSKWKSLHHRLHELYSEECGKPPSNKHLKTGVHLLDKLAKREKLTCLIVSLGSQGYSLMLRGENGAETETMRLPYEESELLEYLDAEELPPVLVDLLEKSQSNIFYNGCVITEVRDYRQSGNGHNYTTRYVLLRPTAQTLLCDINSISNDGNRFTNDEKLHLESQLLLATQEPLCLDPSPAVTCLENKIHQDRHRLNGRALKRCMKRHSHIMRARRAALKTLAPPKELGLQDFLCKRKDRTPAVPVNLKLGKTCVDMWKQRETDYPPADISLVEQLSSCQERPRPSSNSLVATVEEILETDRGNGKVHYARVSIYQHQLDQSYVGELYYDRDYNVHEGKRPGVTCRFPLGSFKNAEMYLHQFRDLFTEEGRRQVKITRIVPGQNAYSNNAAASTAAATASHGSAGAAAGNSNTSVQTSLQQNNSNNQVGQVAAQVAAHVAAQTPSQAAGIVIKAEPGLSDSSALRLSLLNNSGGLSSPATSLSAHLFQGNTITLGAAPQQSTQPSVPILSPPITAGRHKGRQPPAYLNLSRASSAPPDSGLMMTSPQGTPTSLPVSSPLSGSMAPPPTPPPPSSTPSFIPAPPSPSVHPNPGRVITPTLEGVAGRVATPTGIASGQMPHSVAVTITMAGGGSIAVPVSMGLVGHSRTGIVQTGGNLISSPISVMTSLPAGFPTDLNSITTTTSTTPPSTTTASTPTSSPTQGNIISTPAGLLTGPINIINAAHGGLLSTGAVSLSGGAQLAAATGITSARLSQLALKGHGGIRAQGPLSLLPQGQQTILYNATLQQRIQQQLQQQYQQHLQQQQQSTSAAAQAQRQGLAGTSGGQQTSSNVVGKNTISATLGSSQTAAVLSQLTAIQASQLTPAHQQALHAQQLQAQLAYQKQQQLQLKQQQQQALQQHASSKGKSKKRTTPTPPK